MNRRTKIIIIASALVVVIGVPSLYLYKTNYLPAINLTNKSWLDGKDKNLPKKDEITSKLPDNASTVRLNLPTSIANLMIAQKKRTSKRLKKNKGIWMFCTTGLLLQPQSLRYC